jgi:sodium/proline symporter
VFRGANPYSMASVVLSFLAFMGLFAVVGTLSIRRKRSAVDDYLLASRSVNPWLTGLSSVVTNNSGYMFIGLIGFTYSHGVSALWLTAGWIVGDAVAWYLVHPRLREVSGASPAETVGALVGEQFGENARPITVLLGVVTIAFLATYAAAQLNAGSKALYVMFDWNVEVGALAGAGIVLLYSYAGGIRASIWTDAAQSVVMMLAMISLAALCLLELGGPTGLWHDLRALDAALVNPVPDDLRFGFALYLVGWLFAGFGAVGQPHILVRTMALREAGLVKVARRVYFGWYVPFAAAAVVVALSARVMMPDVGAFDPELALPLLAGELMPGVLVGIVLAGIFAATISTADSQLLTCAAAFTQDIFPRAGQTYTRAKLGTAVTTALVLAVVVAAPANVFDLVVVAWSALGAGVGPLLLVRLHGRPPPVAVAVTMICAGVAVSVAWGLVLGWTMDIYELLPGMMAGSAVYAVWRGWMRLRRDSIPPPEDEGGNGP